MKNKWVFIFLILLPSLCFAQTENWTLATSPFELLTDPDIILPKNKKLVEDLKVLLPKLLLESFDGKYSRKLTIEEQLAKEIYKLEAKKRDLYKAYETSILKRDSVFLTHSSKYTKKQNIKAEEKKIKAQEEEILALQKEIDSLKTSNQNKKGFTSQKKKILIYQNAKDLFSLSKKASSIEQKNNLVLDEKEKKLSIENKKKEIEIEALSKNIDALISGEMEVNGDFLQVTLHFDCFPRVFESMSFTFISALKDVSYIVSLMHETILQELINEPLIEIAFKVQPEEAEKNLVLHIADEVYKNNFDSIFLPKSEYTIFAEAEGYSPISFMYNFNEEVKYEISLDLKKIESKTISLNAKDEGSSFSLNAESFGSLPRNIDLDESQYLGQILNEDWTNYFLLHKKDFSNNEKTLSYLNFPIEDKIRKSRNRLYFSYGAVLFALPVYLFSSAHYDILLNAKYNDLGVAEGLETWNLISTLSFVGVSALGLNMGIQLVLYLNDANKVIPK